MGDATLIRYDLDERELHLLEIGIDDKRRAMSLTVILWFFLVHFGAHRFYLGKWKTALLLIGIEVLLLLVLVGSGSNDESGIEGALGFLAWFWFVLPLVWAVEGIRLPFLLRHDRRTAERETLEELARARQTI